MCAFISFLFGNLLAAVIFDMDTDIISEGALRII